MEIGIGSPDSFSVLEIAKMFETEIELIPDRHGNRMFSDLITNKTINLGWFPKKQLKKI